MDSYEHNTCSFIVKIWLEETDANTEQKTWRGHITHVYSGNRRYLENLVVITDFIDQYLKEMKTNSDDTNSYLGGGSMPVSPTYPGVYIEEIPSGVRTITGVATSITAFVGRARRGPTDEPVTINSYGDYERIFGGLWSESSMSYAVRDFYLNGGSQAIIVRLYHPSYTDSQRQIAREAAQSFAEQIEEDDCANAESDPRVTVASVKKAIKSRAEAERSAIKDDAVRIVAYYAANSPLGTTARLVMNVARISADLPDNTQGPRKTTADLVAKAAHDAAQVTNATPDDVAQAAFAKATDIADEGGKIKTSVTSIAEAAKAATAGNAAVDARKEAENFKSKPEYYQWVTKVAAAAEKPGADPVAAATTEAAAARSAIDSQIEAAKDVALAAKKEAAKGIANIVKAAKGAIDFAAPLPKSQLAVDVLELEAANQGTWANQLRARVDHDLPTLLPENYVPYKLSIDDLFNLIVRDCETGLTEVFRNVTVKPSPRQVDKVLENESRLVRVRGTLDPNYPEESKSPQKGQMPWGDNEPTTNYKVSEPASDGRTLQQADFTERGEKAGLYALEKADLFNLLCIPPCLDDPDAFAILLEVAAQYCEKRRAMLIVDPPSGWINKEEAKKLTGVNTRSKNAALFFPRLKQPNPLHDNQVEEFAPCGVVAGIFARTDSTRGIWKAPAGLEATLVGVPELSVSLTDLENGELNQLGINCLRTMPGVGRVVWGARTLQGNDRLASEWKYIPVRRLALFIEESLYRGTQWVVFEPNDEPLWAQIRLNIGAFMNNLFRQGAFQGRTPREAYFVKCDKETTTQNDINLGIVNILVGFAPLKPAEFVIIQLQQMAGQIQV